MVLSTLSEYNLQDILQRAALEEPLSYQDIIYLLSLKEPKEINQVMLTAQQLRQKYFGEEVFLYGFIYFTTFCRNHCTFCYYRQSNQVSPRYRKSLAEITEIAAGLAESGVHLIDLTMGEDPAMHDSGNFTELLEITRQVKETTGLPVMVSPGVVPDQVLHQLSLLGVDWYALYQETHNVQLYRKLRVGQSFKERIVKRSKARQLNMLVEDGILLGVGESTADRADSLLAMKQAGADQVRVMSLVPQSQTPLAGLVSPPRRMEYLYIAVMRLIMPNRLIPASLDVDGIKGLRMRLKAGANVVTSIIPPSTNLAGVSQSTLDIDQGYRSVSEVRKILAGLGLEAASLSTYRNWLQSRKDEAGREDNLGENSYYRGTAARLRSSLSGQAGGVSGNLN